MQLLGHTFELDTSYEASTTRTRRDMELNYFTEHVFAHAYSCLPSKIRLNYGTEVQRMINMIGLETGERTFVYDMEEYTGNLQYRIRKYCQLKGWNIEEAYKYINQAIVNFTEIKFNSVVLQFTNTIDWNPGDFHESTGSCWWDESGYSTGKANLMYNMLLDNAFAIKFWNKKGAPLGRAFAVFVPGTRSFILFNLYIRSGYAGSDFLNIFSEFLGVDYRTVTLYLRSNANFYVNNNKGYLFSSNGVATRNNFSIDLTPYHAPYDPEIERYRINPRITGQLQCEKCNRYGTHNIYFIKPYKQVICGPCRSANGISLGPFETNSRGDVVYYDDRYYRRSKKTNRIVKRRGMTWEA